jgi:hypothetical protein
MKLTKLDPPQNVLDGTELLPGVQKVGSRWLPAKFSLSALAAYFGVSGGGGGSSTFTLNCGDASGVVAPDVTINCGGA